MTIRAAVLFSAAMLFSVLSVQLPAEAANLGDPSSLKEKAPAVYKAKSRVMRRLREALGDLSE